MRLRPGQHLRRQSDIRQVRQQGSRMDCKAFTLWWIAGSAKPDSRRACFVASTQAVGKAVLRNRAKRRMREVFRQHQSKLPASIDMMMVARSKLNEWPYAEVDQAFSGACGKIMAPKGA